MIAPPGRISADRASIAIAPRAADHLDAVEPRAPVTLDRVAVEASDRERGARLPLAVSSPSGSLDSPSSRLGVAARKRCVIFDSSLDLRGRA